MGGILTVLKVAEFFLWIDVYLEFCSVAIEV